MRKCCVGSLFVVLFCATLLTPSVNARSVGLWKDARSYITDGMLKTLQDAGWETVILEKRDLSDREKLDKLDVIFLPGGWNAYYFADFNARRELVRFAAGGKGILAGAFRSGYVRTANRPFFPQVGATYNRVNGPYVWGYGDSELAKAIDKPFCPGGWDHLVVKVGPDGKVFAVSADDPVGVYGEVYGGRYVIFGAFIGMDAKTDPMKGTPRNALLAMLEWLDSAPKLDDKKRESFRLKADLDLLRREKLYDLTMDERGPDRSPGVLPEVRNKLAIPLESRLYKLQYMAQFLSGKQSKQCESEMKTLEAAISKLDRDYAGELKKTTARIQKMNVQQLLAENPVAQGTNLAAMVKSVPGKTEEEQKGMLGLLNRCSAGRAPVYASKKLALYLHADEYSKKFFSAAELDKLTARADKTISTLTPVVKAAKAKQAKEERKADLAAIPNLVRDCSSKNIDTRRKAVVELGRIGDPKTAPTLIKMLSDPDEKVRIDSIIGLGWMQSKESVPELIKIVNGKELHSKRRAIQSLGQIGDARAIKPIMACIKDKDYFVAENAIMSLGWLKAKQAVPELVKIATSFDPEVPEQRGLMFASIRALGHIGDKSALPALEKILTEADDYPMSRRGKKEIANIYSTPQSLGLKGYSGLAIEEIKAGGLAKPGIKQADFLSRKDRFYGLTGNFNALAGRTSHLRRSNFAADPAALWPYMWEAGFTGVHQAWGEQDADPDEYMELIKGADDLDLLWIEVMPLDGNVFGSKQCYSKYRQHAINKPGAEVVIMKHSDTPAFQGFWSEESYPQVAITAPEFEAWLTAKYGADFRKKLGLKKDENLIAMDGKAYAEYKGPLKTEYLLFCGEKLVEHWQESQEWLHGMRKGCAFTYSITSILTVKFPGLTGKAGSAIDANGPENYQCFGRYNAFFMEMHKDGEPKPVMSEFYNWYSRSPASDIRGFAQHLMHGECFYCFALHQIFGQPSTYDMWAWDSNRWCDAKQVFTKARKTSEYLGVPESAANVAILASELSFTPFYAVTLHDSRGSLLYRWYQNQAGLWVALNQSQIPSDIIWTETLTPEKLARYRVLVLSDAKIITEPQARQIREWVDNGGALIASGTTSLFDDHAQLMNNYRLSDLFGVDYIKNMGVSDPNKIDTFCWNSGGKTAFKAVSGLDPDNFRYHVHRGVKPVKSLGMYTVCKEPKKHLPGIQPSIPVEYDMPLGYDKVKPTTSEVLAQFRNGDPALTVNKVGKGLCYFWTPIYPGLCHVTSEWEMQPNKLEFWPNVRELLAAMVEGGLEQQEANLPVEIIGTPKEVEVTLRKQPEKNRWMVHLLNYDTGTDKVKGPEMLVHPSDGRKVKRIFYPDTDTDIKFELTDNCVKTHMRDFNTYDMVVIEWE